MQKGEGHQVRTCLFCRAREAKEKLCRFVYDGKGLRWDKKQNLPGRGAYIHARVDCIKRMVALGKWENHLKLPAGALDVVNVRELMQEVLNEVLSLDVGSDGRGIGELEDCVGRKRLRL